MQTIRKTNYAYITFFFLPLAITSCKEKNGGLFVDKCPMSYKLEWQVVEKGVSGDEQIQVLSKLKTAAKVEADRLTQIIGKGEADADVKVGVELTKTLQSNEVRKAKVSQDVFDQFVRTRAASCAIWEAINGKIYGNDQEALKRAREEFTNLQVQFGRWEEKKKKEQSLH